MVTCNIFIYHFSLSICLFCLLFPYFQGMYQSQWDNFIFHGVINIHEKKLDGMVTWNTYILSFLSVCPNAIFFSYLLLPYFQGIYQRQWDTFIFHRVLYMKKKKKNTAGNMQHFIYHLSARLLFLSLTFLLSRHLCQS